MRSLFSRFSNICKNLELETTLAPGHFKQSTQEETRPLSSSAEGSYCCLCPSCDLPGSYPVIDSIQLQVPFLSFGTEGWQMSTFIIKRLCSSQVAIYFPAEIYTRVLVSLPFREDTSTVTWEGAKGSQGLLCVINHTLSRSY